MMSNIDRYVKDIPEWIRVQVAYANKGGVVIGLSGGIDSAVVAALCSLSLKDCVTGVIMPCHSDSKDEEHAYELAGKFHIVTAHIDLSSIFDLFSNLLPGDDILARGNIKSRLRMITLYHLAHTSNRLVVGTGNLSEHMIGYFTKYGDGGTDIEPIGNLTKTEVVELATALGVPASIIDKPPSAGLWEHQTDEDELGIKYADLDPILKKLQESPEGEGGELEDKIKGMIRSSEHKRNMPPTLQL